MLSAAQLKQYQQAVYMLISECDRAFHYMQLFGRHLAQPGGYKITAASLAVYAVEDMLKAATRLHQLAIQLNEPRRMAHAKEMLEGLQATSAEFMAMAQQIFNIGMSKDDTTNLEWQLSAPTLTPELKLSNRESSRFLPLFSQLEEERTAPAEATKTSKLPSTLLTWSDSLNPQAAPYSPTRIPIPIGNQCYVYQ